MAKTTFVQNSLVGGEWSPRFLGRSDLEGYRNALQLCKNFILLREGGGIRRSGTRYVSAAKYNNKLTRLIPFAFSVEQTYIIEFGDLYVRFYRDEGQLTSGGSPVEVTTPYPYTTLREVKYTQSADVLYLCHPDYSPRQLNRVTDTNWTLTAFDYIDGPYLDINTTATTMTCTANTGTSKTLTASATTGINGGDGFKSTDVGRLVRLKFTNWGYVKITGFTSTTQVTVDVVEDLDAATPGTTTTTNWRMGAWSDTTGWPWTTVFHDGRLWFGGTDSKPQTLWGSVVGDFTNFQPSQADGTVADDDAVTVTIDDDQVNAIRWIKSVARGLAIGTAGGAFILGTSNVFDPITPTNFSYRRQVTEGSHETVPPQQIGNVVLYPERGGHRWLEYTFNFEDDQFVANDMTMLAGHITGSGGVVDSALSTEPFRVLWSVRSDGLLIGFTYQRDQKVAGWHRHVIGGNCDGGSACVESIGVIREGLADQLWMVVKRTINGSTVRYIEFMESEFNGDAQTDAFFVDSGLSTAAPTQTVTGLDHLEGETVQVLADGGTHPDATVSGGQITLNDVYDKAHVGLFSDGQTTTMPLFASAGFDPRGKHARVYALMLQLYESLGLEIGDPDVGTFDVIDLRDPATPMGDPSPLFTGLKNQSIQSAQSKQPTVSIKHTQPLPATVLAIIAEMEVGGV